VNGSPLGPSQFRIARRSLYGGSYVPDIFIDGMYNYTGDSDAYNVYKSIIQTRLAVPSPMTIGIAASIGKDTLNVTVDVYLEQDVPTGSKIYLLACENHIVTGGKTYQFVERCQDSQYPIINGEPLGVYSSGQSTTFNATVDFDDLAYQNPLMMYLICWVQDMDSGSPTYKEVLQSAQLYDPPYDSDLSIQPSSLGKVRSLYH
jgi:hypothetical protein